MDFFENIMSHEVYLEENQFHEKLGIALKKCGRLQRKVERSYYHAVTAEFADLFEAELDDLVRLRYRVRSRKVKTIFGFGWAKF